MGGNGRDLVWIAGKPVRSSAASAVALKPQLKAKPKAESVVKQQLQNAPSSVASESGSVSENVDPNTSNLTFSQLCQEDKSKIGALIRKLITLKAEYSQEAMNVKKEKMRFDQELNSIQQHNQKIQNQTKELKTHFSSSLALLKIYKEKVHQQEAEKTERDRKIDDLTKELENMKQQIEKNFETNAVNQKSDRPVLDANCPESTLNIRATETERIAVASNNLAEENQRLKRLLDIQNFKNVSKPANKHCKPDPVDDRSCNSSETKSEDRQSSEMQTVCKCCLQNERVLQASTSGKGGSMDSPPPADAANLGPSSDGVDSDDEQALIKELNNHRDHFETLLYLHNDVSLLQALETINLQGQEDDGLHPVNISSNSDDEEVLQAITKDLNRRHKASRSNVHINDTSGFS